MTGVTRELAIFPLGSVLLPGMPLPLRVFEPRYVEMLAAVLAEPEPEFGVVLIERGSEVGGGDVRFAVGTVARLVSIEQSAGSILLVAVGGARFEVTRWLQDDPFPRAVVRELEPLEFDEPARAVLGPAEALVRTTLARASEFVEVPWAADVELSVDPEQRIWQLAGIAPLNPMDHYALLRSTSASQLLARLVDDSRAADVLLTAGWGADPYDPGDLPE